ncbi:hypothetical protein Tco_1434812 [Tanacetum coccineum]
MSTTALMMRILRDVGKCSVFLEMRLVSRYPRISEDGNIQLSGCIHFTCWMLAQNPLDAIQAQGLRGFDFNNIPLYCDTPKVLLLYCCNKVQHSRSKHIWTFGTTYPKSKWRKIDGLNYTFHGNELSIADIITKPYPENGSNFFFHA